MPRSPYTHEHEQHHEARCLIPVGAVEQHGPHMPVSVDVLLSTTTAELTAEHLGAALVGPTITTGYKSQQRSGTFLHPDRGRPQYKRG
ncbi:creatininase family protein [Actinomyces ruminicola]|uniref:creatininase family protein n=1 Tax=Actinomyces ruminicola TaxID=332524 RepID=UPI000B8417E8|nr:creatininase family protein [Actinomyces ruminicola]